VVPIVQGGTTKKANVNLFGGTFSSSNIARVDPTGSDSTGTVGELSKPFLTVQGAIDAIEAGSFSSPLIDIGENDFSGEDVTTALDILLFRAASVNAIAFNTLTCTEPTNQVGVFFFDVTGGDVSSLSTGGLTIELFGSQLSHTTNSAGNLTVSGDTFAQITRLSAPGFLVTMNGFPFWGKYASINSAGSLVQIFNSTLGTLTAAASAELTDSRIITNNAGITPTYTDILLNPALMDFSTLPTTEPSTVGAAWIDTTGGLNIVKVHL
jgi:hypothetical protein